MPHRLGARRLFMRRRLAGFVSTLPVAVSRYRSAAMRSLLTGLMDQHHFDAVVCDFLAAAPNLPSLKGAVLFQHNMETTLWERHAANAPDALQRALFRRQARLMALYEGQVCREVRQVIAVSEADAERMRSRFAAPHVDAVPTGVDVEYFAPPDAPPPGGADLVFLGSMDWSPNVDGMLWFAEEVWPRIAAHVPAARLDHRRAHAAALDTGPGGTRPAHSGHRHGSGRAAILVERQGIDRASADRRRDPPEDLRGDGRRCAGGFDNGRSRGPAPDFERKPFCWAISPRISPIIASACSMMSLFAKPNRPSRAYRALVADATFRGIRLPAASRNCSRYS